MAAKKTSVKKVSKTAKATKPEAANNPVKKTGAVQRAVDVNHMFHLPQAFGTLDTVATFANIENVYRAMKRVIEEQFPMARYIGHFSHWYEWGCMLYARFIVDRAPDDPHEAVQLHNRIWDTCLRAAMKEGGLLNEHHGIGLKLGRLMKELYGPAYAVLESVKKAFDPHNIMNPGKMGFETFR